ncbi:bifunctional 2-polyprenyl-6-hydroxyphenol methylase/3-demethylubiquinol 3-O-methyltransferase UbiG [Methyloversatilis sp.]|uniref:bifunctional 2-polyprenyl-6-hydroxyphenol methylase/3-demethylubiquinol 3-O-methyltransferase UbiG n=1 Tax=Methyloversatilis sp. TaxID=2569862 RepID=UPI0027B948A9|nr:bifunctional 2-polyprenyl-6-hydroxyphenol methylase/3-demethylubiquinol 3-O-methyltransferase UbiG [Methyloversatilis sp.]
MTTQQNADPLELEKFSELAHRWWDPESEFRPLHEINPLRLDWIDRCIGIAGKRVLDVGCGGGILSESMASRGADVTGIDLSEKALSVARLHLLESGRNVRYLLQSAEDHARESAGQYDVVTCMEMLEHVPDPASTIRACAAMVRPGGTVFFSTLNRNPKSWLFAIVGAEYVLRLLPRGTHEYEKFIKPSELAQDARAAGLREAEMMGMSYNPLTQVYSLGRDTSVNYLMRCLRDE